MKRESRTSREAMKRYQLEILREVTRAVINEVKDTKLKDLTNHQWHQRTVIIQSAVSAFAYSIQKMPK